MHEVGVSKQAGKQAMKSTIPVIRIIVLYKGRAHGAKRVWGIYECTTLRTHNIKKTACLQVQASLLLCLLTHQVVTGLRRHYFVWPSTATTLPLTYLQHYY